MKFRRGVAPWCVALGLLLAGAAQGGAAEAERQYRVARRLAAERSPEAAQALQKVVELDPEGPLADDATLDEALLAPLPRWPEDLARIDEAAAARGLELTGRVLKQFPQGNRAAEARYHHALLLLEPLPAQDAARARLELVAVSTDPGAASWSARARYALAWLAWRRQDPRRGAATMQRLYVDDPSTEVAARAAAGLGRQALMEGDFGQAAIWFRRSLEVDEATPGSRDFLELAVRSLLRRRGGAPAPKPEAVLATGVRTLAGLTASPDGGVVLADRREGTLWWFGRGGASRASWPLADPSAVAASAGGPVYAAAGDRLFAVDPQAGPLPLADLGDWAPAKGLAAEETGALWILDRRGERLGRLRHGAAAPETLWEEPGTRLTAIAWDGRHLLALDGRGGRLLRIVPGEPAVDLGGGLQRPEALAVDAAGTVAVLDTKAGAIIVLDPRGKTLFRLDCRQAGLARPAALAFGNDGVLHVFDGSNGTWQEIP